VVEVQKSGVTEGRLSAGFRRHWPFRWIRCRNRTDTPALLAALPAWFVIGGLVVLPVIGTVLLSFSEWDVQRRSFNGFPTFTAYWQLFAWHKIGLELRCLALASAASIGVALLGIPVVLFLKVNRLERHLLAFELLLLAPFLASPAIRLHGIRNLLAPDGLASRVVVLLGGDASFLSDNLLFSWQGVVIGLASSYSALLLLPAIQSARMLDSSLLQAAEDMGLSRTRSAIEVVLKLSGSGILAGLILMTVVSWFSTLEYEILGHGRSILVLLASLVRAGDYPQLFAAAVLPFMVTGLAFVFVVRFLRPELLFSRFSKDDEG